MGYQTAIEIGIAGTQDKARDATAGQGQGVMTSQALPGMAFNANTVRIKEVKNRAKVRVHGADFYHIGAGYPGHIGIIIKIDCPGIIGPYQPGIQTGL